MNFNNLPLPEAGSTVAVGMSGGVDSTLVAILLKERGCNVIGVTMSSWNNDLPLPSSENKIRNSCYGPDEQLDIDEVIKFCKENQIPHYVVDVKKEYKKEVLEYFKQEYRAGRTPNPCIMCNPKVKFGALLNNLQKQNIHFDYFCTGHYAQLVRCEQPIWELYNDEEPINKNELEATGQLCSYPIIIKAATDVTKDQAYFLYRIPFSTLEKVRFPLGTMTKKEVYEIANLKTLKAASRSESQDFVPPEYFDIIFSDKASIPGDIINLDGKVLGKHRGIEHYTIGQRRGLGVSANKPLYVHSIDVKNNLVVLSENEELNASGLIAENWVWAGNYQPKKSFIGLVKIRLASKPVEATIIPDANNSYKVLFSTPQYAVAPGQSVVVYIDGLIVGGGLIKQAI